jgi:hypothetical protein
VYSHIPDTPSAAFPRSDQVRLTPCPPPPQLKEALPAVSYFALLNSFDPSALYCSLIDGPEVEHGAHFLILYYPPLSVALRTRRRAMRGGSGRQLQRQQLLARGDAAQ